MQSLELELELRLEEVLERRLAQLPLALSYQKAGVLAVQLYPKSFDSVRDWVCWKI